jgi:hypothetical protein
MENWNRTRSESKDISPTSPPAALLSPLDPAWARIACDGEIHGNDLQWGEDHHICPSECQAREAAAFTHSSGLKTTPAVLLSLSHSGDTE